MNLTKLIELKERIAISDAYTPAERDFILDAVNDKIAAVVIVHAPANYLGRIEAIHAVLSVDAGGEGVVAAPIAGVTFPLIAADKARLADIIPLARALAPRFGKVLRLARFTTREDLEIFQP